MLRLAALDTADATEILNRSRHRILEPAARVGSFDTWLDIGVALALRLTEAGIPAVLVRLDETGLLKGLVVRSGAIKAFLKRVWLRERTSDWYDAAQGNRGADRGDLARRSEMPFPRMAAV